ncbi:MAG TPA: alcohol dehydrogenase catalytic domain-containing protein [Bryobacteraceae bacterium]|nr:alcohol dehydrogenase catalytic domain-containing protein [Bryobacteraceae bacterium]
MKASLYREKLSMGVGECMPIAPGPGQVQIAVSHCGICGTDLHIFQGHMDHRVKTPAVLGHEMSGTIAAVGAGVEGWAAGDRVTVMPLDPCSSYLPREGTGGEPCPACKAGHSHICQKLRFIGIDVPGALQGIWTVPAHTLHRLPDNLPLEHAALVEPIAVACHDVRLGEVKQGDYAVVIGAGPIGTLVALVARHAGANVLVTEVNPFRIRLARELGLNVVDAREVDVVALVNEQTGTAGADVVFEVSGSAAGADLMTKLPRTRGRVVIVAIFAQPPAVNLFQFFWRELKLCGARVYEHQDFDEAIDLAASGVIPIPRIISGVYGLDGVQGALEQMLKGGEVMKILIDCKS